jgi:hypothetical protein
MGRWSHWLGALEIADLCIPGVFSLRRLLIFARVVAKYERQSKALVNSRKGCCLRPVGDNCGRGEHLTRFRSLGKSLDQQCTFQLGMLAGLLLGTLILIARPGYISSIGLQCPTRILFGLKCPFCGMTTDFVQILHGLPPSRNPCSFLAFTTVYLLYPAVLIRVAVERNFGLLHHAATKRAIVLALFVMFVLNNFGSWSFRWIM